MSPSKALAAAGKVHDGQIMHVLGFKNDKLQQMDIYEHRHF